MAHTPTFVAKGAFASGIAALSVAAPTTYRNDDVLLLFVESANQNITAPAGWTEVTNSPQSTGSAGAAGGVRLAVFWKLASGAEPATTVADTGDHQTAIIMAFRGVDPANPIDVTAGSVGAATTAMVFPSVTTTQANDLIVLAAGMDTDAASTTTMGTVTNANLTGITEQHDQTVASGAGGGLAIATGLKVTAGSTGTSTATGSTAVTHAYLTIALRSRASALTTPRGQYLSDFVTPLPVGGNVAAANDGAVIMSDVTPMASLDEIIQYKTESRTVGTAFTNVATTTNPDFVTETSASNYGMRGAAMVYDVKNDRYVTFGGYDGTTRQNHIWAKDMSTPGRPWRRITPTGTAPTGRNLHSAVYVRGTTSGAVDKAYMVVFGGFTSADNNDMYTVDLTTPGAEAWATVTQTGAPTARSYITKNMVSTPVTGQASQNYVYLFGGYAGSARVNDLQRFTFNVNTPTAVTWTVLKANGAAGNPGIRDGCILDYKASTNKLYMYGGYSGSAVYNDFWEYDIAGNTWTQLSPTGTAPTGTSLGAGGYDPVNNRFWFAAGWANTQATTRNHIGYVSNVGDTPSTSTYYFNGSVSITDTAGTWTNDANAFDGSTSTFATGGNGTLNKLEGVGTNAPSSGGGITQVRVRHYGTGNTQPDAGSHAVVYSGAEQLGATSLSSSTAAWSGYTTLSTPTGGWTWAKLQGLKTAINQDGSGTADIYRVEIEVSTGSSWVEVRAHDADNQGFASQANVAVAYDSKRNWIVIKGQMTFESTERYSFLIDLNENYTSNYPVYSLSEGDWMGARDAPASVWDPNQGEFLVINGFAQMPDEQTIVQGTHVSEAWAYNPTTNSWRYAVKGHKAMPMTEGSSAVYDTLRKRIIVFGGLSGAAETHNEVWSLTADQFGMYEWKKLNVSGTPPFARWLTAAVYDPTFDRMLIAMGGSGDTIAPSNVIWEISFANSADGQWISRTPTGTATAVWGPGFANAPEYKRLYIFGGATNAALSTVSSQLVYLDYSAQTPAWVTPTSSSGTARRTPAFGYDSVNKRLIVFGGLAGGTSTQNLQYWDVVNGGAWTTTQPTVQPDARRSPGSIFANGKFYMTHGRTDSSKWFANTWELTPNYTTPASSTWFNEVPRKYQPQYALYDPNTSGSYHWQAWTDEDGVSGPKASFGSNTESFADFRLGVTPTGPPTVTTSAATSIIATRAMGNGEVTGDGTGAISERGFVWALSTSADPTVSTNAGKVTVAGTTGTFSTYMNGLTYLTNYKYRAYATNASGTSYGAVQTFSTPAGTPTASVQRYSAGSTTIAISGNVELRGSTWATERGFAWSATQGGAVTGTHVTVSGGLGGEMSTIITGLTANTTYYVSAFVGNGGSGSYSNEVAIRTTSNNQPPIVSLVTSEANAFSTTTPTLQFKGVDPDSTDKITYGIDIDTVSTFDSQLTSVTGNTAYNQGFILRAGSTVKIGQSIQVGSDTTLSRVRFLLGRAGNPVGQFRATVYPTTGTHGSSAVGTGTPLVTSSTYYSSNGIPQTSTDPVWYDFWFDNAFTLQAGVTYAVVVEIYGGITDGTSDYIIVFANPNGSHDGNSMNMTNTGTWNAVNTSDIAFEVHTGSRYHYRQSNTHVGFANTQDSADTDPFTNQQIASYTVSDQTVNSYYFDGSDGTLNHNSAWTNPANLYNGDLTSYTNRNSATAGSASANYLHVQGTNAPASGGTIDLVRVRAYMHGVGGPSLPNLEISTDGLAQQLELIPLPTWSGIGWTPFFSLDTPSGGWTWAKVQDLEAKLWLAATSAYDTRFYRLDVEVVSSNAAALPQGTYYWRAIAYDAFNSALYGPYSPTQSFTVSGTTSYTKTHSTSSVKRKQFTPSHTTDTFRQARAGVATSTLTDTFSGTDIDSGKWVADYAGLYYAVSGGQITVYARNNFQTIRSVNYYDLSGSSVYIQIPNFGTMSTDKEAHISVRGDGNSAVRFGIDTYNGVGSPVIRASVTKSAGSQEYNQTLAYNSTNHQYLRIRQVTRTFYFDTSPDGTNWTNVFSYTSATVDMGYAKITFGSGGTSGANDDPVVFDNLNFVPAASFTKTHSTDAVKRKATTLTHTTSANKKVSGFTKTHTTDAVKRKVFLAVHTTSANKKTANLLKTHTTSANKKKALTVSHTTDAQLLQAKQTLTKTHTTDALKRVQSIKSHTTDSLKRQAITRTHTTSANKRLATLKTHTTNALKRKATLVSHTTSANRKKATAVSHTTNSLLRKQFSLTHTTDSLKRAANLKSHTTDSLKRTVTAVSHTTDARLRRVGAAKVKVLVVAGGGSGGGSTAGGGGAGGVLYDSSHDIFSQTYNVTVGAGAPAVSQREPGIDGQNSVFDNLTAIGGGGGGYTYDSIGGAAGRPGGSGGGGAMYTGAGSYGPGAGTPGQGHDGGNYGTENYPGGGGGGAGSVGQDGSGSKSGDGGAGIANPIPGSTVGVNVSGTYYLAGGGGGGSQFNGGGGAGGIGGGGAGTSNGGAGFAGAANTGSGGGGGWYYASGNGGAGGSGVVVISFPTAELQSHSATGSYTVTTVGDDTIYTFTGSGTFTPVTYGGYTKTHTTDAFKRTSATVSHTTDAIKRSTSVLSHSTSANKRKAFTVSHSTSANKKVAGFTRTHTTNALKRKAFTLSHTTNALKRSVGTLSHSTSALIRRSGTLTHSTNALKRKATLVSHTTDANKKRSYSVLHTTSANKRTANNLRTHTTSSVKRKQFTLAHTTDSFKRTGYTLSHTTNALLRRQLTRTHTTDALKRKAFTPFHTTNANKRRATLVSHTTNALKRSLNTRSHTTDAFKRTAFTLAHTTDALLKRRLTLSHTTDSYLRAGFSKNHTTDANKRRAYSIAHTTSANKRKALTVFHTTSANRRKATLVTHTTNSLLRKAVTLAHTTSANKRKAFTLTHTTSAIKRSANIRSHTTDSFKRTANVLSHTTDSFIRKSRQLSHSTDSFLRRAVSLTHTTDANKKRGYSLAHTTDSNKRRSYSASHTTSANKRTAANVVSHSTNALLRRAISLSHTTDTVKRTITAKSHTTDSLLRRAVQLTHSTNANKRKALQVSHTTDTLKRTANVKSHTTDTLKRRLLTLSHSTDSFLRRRLTLSHSTDAFRRTGFQVTHSTSANLRRAYSVAHSTDANKRKSGNLVSHTTSTAIRKANTLAHTTDTVKRTLNVVSHSTNAFLRKSSTLSHSTNSLLRRAVTASHSTSANKRKATLLTHTTSANKRRAFTRTHTTSANKRKTNLLLTHTTNALLRKAFTRAHLTDANKKRSGNTVSHSTSTYMRSGFQLAHNTDANIRKSGLTRSHTTDTVKRKSNVISHTTSAFLRKGNFVAHTTSANLRKALTRFHTTSANKRKATILSHTTNANKRKATIVSHSTDANRKKAGNILSHTTDSVLRRAIVLTHSTSALKRRGFSVSHSTDALKAGATLKSHTTDTLKRREVSLSHTTDSNLRDSYDVSHSTDSFIRRAIALQHSTSANKRRAFVAAHQTNANKRKANQHSHTTSANLRGVSTVDHTTDSLLHIAATVDHSTDALLRGQAAIAHSTDSNKKKVDNTVSHSTDASMATQTAVAHHTDAFLRTLRGKKWVIDSGEWKLAPVYYLKDGVWHEATVYHRDGSQWVETY